MEEKPLTDVHKAMYQAASEPTENQPMDTYSIRMPKDLADNLKALCERHGTSMSEFFRHCAQGLVEDYKS